MKKVQITDLIEFSKEQIKTYPYLRLGQQLFNNLYDINPELANNIRGTKYDPFYNDDVIPEFLKYIQNED